MDRCANGSGQIDAVVEVPAISVDARTEGRVHLVRRVGLLLRGQMKERASSAEDTF